MDNTVPVLRVTEIAMYLDCSAKFFFGVMEKIPVPKAIPLAFGTAVHSALETNYGQKIETKADLPKSDVLDAFSDAFEAESEMVDPVEWKEEDKGEVKDSGIRLLDNYQDTVAPGIMPEVVERRIEIKVGDLPFNLSGKIDLIDNQQTIVDHKTTARKPQEPSYGNKLQAGFYKKLANADGLEIKRNRIDYLVNKKSPEVVSFDVESDPEHSIRMFLAVTDGINKGVFVPNRGSILCSHKYCKWAEFCERRFGGKVKQ